MKMLDEVCFILIKLFDYEKKSIVVITVVGRLASCRCSVHLWLSLRL